MLVLTIELSQANMLVLTLVSTRIRSVETMLETMHVIMPANILGFTQTPLLVTTHVVSLVSTLATSLVTLLETMQERLLANILVHTLVNS